MATVTITFRSGNSFTFQDPYNDARALLDDFQRANNGAGNKVGRYQVRVGTPANAPSATRHIAVNFSEVEVVEYND